MIAFRNFFNRSRIVFNSHIRGYTQKIPRCSNSFPCNTAEENIESCFLSNGMQLICETRDSLTTTVGFMVPAGSMVESCEDRGGSLFMEHLLFKRTMNRSQEDIEKELINIGGKLFAFALRDTFLFYGIVWRKNTREMIEILADIILNGLICEEDVAGVKPQIFREVDKTESNPEKVIMEYFPMIAYQDTKLAQGVHPETDKIRGMCSSELNCFKEKHFKICCMTMISIGPISLNELQNLICQYFPDVGTDYVSIAGASKAESMPQKCYRYTGADLRIRDDDHELGYVGIGVEGPSFTDLYDRFTMEIAKRIIGSWDKSFAGANHNAPYIAHLAFNTDICESYKSFILDWEDASIWGCYFVCTKMKLEYMSNLIQTEWRKLSIDVIEKVVRRATNQCKFSELMKFNDPVARFHDLVNYIHRHGRYVPMEERLRIYNSISADTVREIARDYLYDQCPTVIALGRIENCPDYNVVRRRMYSLFF
ncbi:mitochondrial-processing peptidase subunit beta-like isoform X2 [Prorops nasuta]|uniref:mitochondrial-processing peptidase subunit beta-like isoform X2 n=1 Tax=Prorops nasuta TaxID=863751 RepID=UPI0034CE60EF